VNGSAAHVDDSTSTITASSTSHTPKQMPQNADGGRSSTKSGHSSLISNRNGVSRRPESNGSASGGVHTGSVRVKTDADGDDSGSGDDRAKKRARQLYFGPSRARGAASNSVGGAPCNQVGEDTLIDRERVCKCFLQRIQFQLQ
jgi:hypothetical protein